MEPNTRSLRGCHNSITTLSMQVPDGMYLQMRSTSHIRVRLLANVSFLRHVREALQALERGSNVIPAAPDKVPDSRHGNKAHEHDRGVVHGVLGDGDGGRH